MKRLVVAIALVAAALVIGATARAAVVPYMSSSWWSVGMGNSSAYSSSWFQNVMSKNAPFDSTITFIDNTSYSWHATRRGTHWYLSTHWLTSQVKKAHCRSNVSVDIRAACTVYS